MGQKTDLAQTLITELGRHGYMVSPGWQKVSGLSRDTNTDHPLIVVSDGLQRIVTDARPGDPEWSALPFDPTIWAPLAPLPPGSL